MAYGKAFTFMFEDPNWVRKLVIGTLLVLIGIFLSWLLIGFIPLLIVGGYTLDLIRNVVNRQRHPLPEWEDWGGMLVRGIKVAAAFVIWFLPLIVVAIPLAIGGNLTESNSGGAQAVGALLLTCGTCLSLLWGLFVTLLSPAILIRLAAFERFASAFEVGALWSLTRDHIGPVIIALLLTWVASLIAGIAGMLGLVFCIVGVLITIPLASLWQYLVMGHLFGQIGAEAGYGPSLRGLEPLEPIVPPSPAPEPFMAEDLPSVAEPVVIVPAAEPPPPEPPAVVPPAEPPPSETLAELLPPEPPIELPPPEPPAGSPEEPPVPPAA